MPRGEQARVRIAQLMLKPADVMFLDEPTNDLDIPALEVLEDSLEEFPGAVVLVSHDRDLMDRLCTSVIGLDGLGGVYCENCDIAPLVETLSNPRAEAERERPFEQRARRSPISAADAEPVPTHGSCSRGVQRRPNAR